MTASAVPLALEGVRFSYGNLRVLENVTLQIDAGDFVCVVGPNGGGKTTLLKLALGLLKPGAGRVSVFGVDPVRARSRVGYVPQHWTFDLQFPMQVIDVVLMGRMGGGRWFGQHGAEDREAAHEALDEMDLNALWDRPFAALSGGQRQRVLIARALASSPELLLLDEPTANVDVKAGEELLLLLKQLNARMTVVMVTHDLGFVSSLVNHVICVNRTAAMHPISELTGDVIAEMYGSDVSMIRHDHKCADHAHGGRG